MADINPDVIKSLAAKLNTLDLTDAEQAVLDGLLRRAAGAGDEVVGFSEHEQDASISGLRLPRTGSDATAIRLGRALGLDADWNEQRDYIGETEKNLGS